LAAVVAAVMALAAELFFNHFRHSQVLLYFKMKLQLATLAELELATEEL
jgi:hypothetical protein